MKHMNKVFKKNWKLNLARKFRDLNITREYFSFMNNDSEGEPSTYEMNDNQMKEFEESCIKRTIRQTFHKMRIRRK